VSERVAVIGAGNWGTALANLLAKKGHDVVIWSFEPDVSHAINSVHQNPRYLRGVVLHERLSATGDLAAAVDGADWLVSVSPSQHVRRVLSEAAPSMKRDSIIVSASKGIEISTLESLDKVLSEVTPVHVAPPAFLSGPSFALEVAREMPTAVTVASRDVVGVELGGALKNVIAVAAGMVSGLGLGHNTLAALITRGLAEIARLGVALGASPLTFMGLAGMGDLILTCTGDLSRNRSVGVELGKGRKLSDILAGMDMVAEGVSTARAAHALALKHGIEMPIVAQVHSVLFEDVPASEAVEILMLREPKPEQWR
jgi:glycerol-3-phosphate dehydrogenase (NAD(P)+)